MIISTCLYIINVFYNKLTFIVIILINPFLHSAEYRYPHRRAVLFGSVQVSSTFLPPLQILQISFIFSKKVHESHISKTTVRTAGVLWRSSKCKEQTSLGHRQRTSLNKTPNFSCPIFNYGSPFTLDRTSDQSRLCVSYRKGLFFSPFL